MKRSRKKSGSTGHSEEPKVLAATNISTRKSISRRDFLRVTTTSLASVAVGSWLSSCSPSEPISTATPVPPPSGTINNDDTALLSFPGDLTSVAFLLAAGTAVELKRRDASKKWIEVRVMEGANAGKEGWIQMVDVSFSSSINVDAAIPISNDIRAMGTAEVKVERVEGKVIYSQDFYAAPGEVEASGSVIEGEAIEVLERDSTDTWFKIRTKNGKEGWIQQYNIKAGPEYTTRIKINHAVVPVAPPSSGDSSGNSGGGGGYYVTYWYPN